MEESSNQDIESSPENSQFDDSRSSEDREDFVKDDSFKSVGGTSYDGGSIKSRPPIRASPSGSPSKLGSIKSRPPIRASPSGSPSKLGADGEKKYSTGHNYYLLAILVVTLAAFFGWRYISSPTVNAFDINSILIDMNKNYPNYSIHFNVYNKQLNRSISSRRIQDQNVIYTLLHPDKSQLANSVAKEMATFGALKLNGSGELCVVDGSIVQNNPSIFNFDVIRKKVTKQRSLVVHNLEQMPLEIIKLFHAICDKYSPFTNRAVVVITVFKIPHIQNVTNFQVFEYFNSLWPDLDEAYRSSLFIRLMENTIYI